MAAASGQAAPFLDGLEKKGEQPNGAWAEDEEVPLSDAIGARGVIRHVLNGLGQVSPAKFRNFHRGSLSEEHASFFEEGLLHTILFGGIEVASIDLPHGFPNHSIHLQGVSVDGGVGTLAFSDSDERSTA